MNMNSNLKSTLQYYNVRNTIWEDIRNSINESMDETMTDFVWNSVRHRVLESVWNTFWAPQIRLSFIQKLAEYKF